MSWKQWVAQRKIYVLFGLAGVSVHEPKRARYWGQFFLYAVVVVAILLLLQWQMELLGDLDSQNLLLINWIVWLFFIIEYTVLTVLVNNKRRYIQQNWLLPIIIFLGIPFVFQITWAAALLRGLRPFLAVLIMIPALRILAMFFRDGQLRTTILATLIIVIIFGVLVAGVDPNIKSAWDGVWWAIATVSTVGYGDVVPTSPLGRLIGMGLVLLGLGVFVVITANFLALILRKETKEIKAEEVRVAKILEEIQELKENQAETLLLLKTLKKRLDDLK